MLLLAPMAAGVRIELTSVVLETTVLAFERTRNVFFVLVCPSGQASFRFVILKGVLEILGGPGELRYLDLQINSLLLCL